MGGFKKNNCYLTNLPRCERLQTLIFPSKSRISAKNAIVFFKTSNFAGRMIFLRKRSTRSNLIRPRYLILFTCRDRRRYSRERARCTSMKYQLYLYFLCWAQSAVTRFVPSWGVIWWRTSYYLADWLAPFTSPLKSVETTHARKRPYGWASRDKIWEVSQNLKWKWKSVMKRKASDQAHDRWGWSISNLKYSIQKFTQNDTKCCRSRKMHTQSCTFARSIHTLAFFARLWDLAHKILYISSNMLQN